VSSARRRWPVGAELVGPGKTHFRVWAPRRRRIDVIVESPSTATVPLEPEENDYFCGIIQVGAGALYRYRLDGSLLCPDPASRFQPQGPFGPSRIVDPSAFAWHDSMWAGVAATACVAYEMHVGTFTPEGDWSAARRQLPRLADLGINLIEIMPVAECPGRFGWGYDGVNLFAPSHLYGTPDDFRAFVDLAHLLGIGVILDVVYNHVGPDGNCLKEFAPAYFSQRHKTDWGPAINFDGEDAGPVREYYLTNAAYWIEEFHLDGLRLDATQNIYDDSPDEHILTAVGRVARAAARKRSIVLVAENEPQHAQLARPIAEGGGGLDMLWNDDFHHTARVAMTGRAEAYYSDHRGRPQELISAVKYGFLFQGQYYRWQKKGRGAPALDLPPRAFVHFLDNHDQVANSGAGLRCHALTSPGRFRTMTALLLLAPQTPMLFQGQEFAASAPFYYFADHKPEIAAVVREGRAKFLAQFPSLKAPERRPRLPDPDAPATFASCKLDLSEVDRHAWAVALHRDLLRLRRDDPTFRRQEARSVDGAVLGPEAFVLRFFGARPAEDRLLLLNLGVDLDMGPMPEPLLAAPPGCRWEVAWSSEDPRYGGGGTGAVPMAADGTLPGHAALVMSPAAAGPADCQPRREGADRDG
jgi:maltooligosyltrehalose trehalohydrolase